MIEPEVRKPYTMHVHKDYETEFLSLAVCYEREDRREVHVIPDDDKTILDLPRDGVTAVYALRDINVLIGPITRGRFGLPIDAREESFEDLIRRAENPETPENGIVIKRVAPEVQEAFEHGYLERLTAMSEERRARESQFRRAPYIVLD